MFLALKLLLLRLLLMPPVTGPSPPSRPRTRLRLLARLSMVFSRGDISREPSPLPPPSLSPILTPVVGRISLLPLRSTPSLPSPMTALPPDDSERAARAAAARDDAGTEGTAASLEGASTSRMLGGVTATAADPLDTEEAAVVTVATLPPLVFQRGPVGATHSGQLGRSACHSPDRARRRSLIAGWATQ